MFKKTELVPLSKSLHIQDIQQNVNTKLLYLLAYVISFLNFNYYKKYRLLLC